MKRFLGEVESNYASFSARWPKELATVRSSLAKSPAGFLSSYQRLVSIQAWRTDLLENLIAPRSLAFFLEAQNDALASHVLAQCGAWRSALQSLRNCIEDALRCLYYKDHPVELELWHAGEHNIAVRGLMEYFGRHPLVSALPAKVNGLSGLAREYRTLSLAVHGGVAFRMTGACSATQLWSSDKRALGKWSTRERCVLTGINLLLLSLFSASLKGTARPGLRRAISLAIPGARHSDIKARLGVTLFTR